MRFDFDSWQGCCVLVSAFGSAITLASIWWNTIKLRRDQDRQKEEMFTLGMRLDWLAKAVDNLYWEVSDRPENLKQQFSRDLYKNQGMED